MALSRPVLGGLLAFLLVGAASAVTSADPAAGTGAGTGASRAGHWPVGSRTGTYVHTAADPAPVGTDPARRLVRATVRQDRAPSTVDARIRLGAVPTASTDAYVVVAFGNVSDGRCQSPAGANLSYDTLDATGGTTSVVVVTGRRLAAAADSAWDCAFAETTPVTPGPTGPATGPATTTYDVVGGALIDHIQKPIISLTSGAARLQPGVFTPVHLRFSDSDRTVAAARHPRLTWEAEGDVVVRGDHTLRTIRPGRSRRTVIMVKPTGPGNGRIRLTVRSGDYRRTFTLKVNPASR